MRNLRQILRAYERGRRFWRHVVVAGRDECWLWAGETDERHRPCFDGRAADVCSYELARGPLAPGAALVRSCRELRCVNPEHLVPTVSAGTDAPDR